MQEHDSTLKLIDRLSELLACLLELKNQGKFQQAIELIDDTFWEYFNFDTSNINQISEEFIRDFLQNSQKASPEIISRLGDLFNEKGDLLFNQNRFKESKDILSNALTIYFYLNDNQDFFSFERMNKMEMINRKLSNIDLKINH